MILKSDIIGAKAWWGMCKSNLSIVSRYYRIVNVMHCPSYASPPYFPKWQVPRFHLKKLKLQNFKVQIFFLCVTNIQISESCIVTVTCRILVQEILHLIHFGCICRKGIGISTAPTRLSTIILLEGQKLKSSLSSDGFAFLKHESCILHGLPCLP
jgi:hypothetical protein